MIILNSLITSPPQLISTIQQSEKPISTGNFCHSSVPDTSHLLPPSEKHCQRPFPLRPASHWTLKHGDALACVIVTSVNSPVCLFLLWSGTSLCYQVPTSGGEDPTGLSWPYRQLQGWTGDGGVMPQTLKVLKHPLPVGTMTNIPDIPPPSKMDSKATKFSAQLM